MNSETENQNWELVIGLEVHAQIISDSKLFSRSSTKFGSQPNDNISLFDIAVPGTLPMLNSRCIEQAVLTGLGLNARINNVSVFSRKHYFYPDLPHGYQITQHDRPIVSEGKIVIDLENGSNKTIRINRLHIEQDAGKLTHDIHPELSLIDFNRSGVALMEIVTEPDIRSAYEASEYVKKLKSILQYIGTCDCNMEEGSLRFDVNVSVRKPNEEYRTKCEVKNVNSIKFMMQAIEYEYKRQVACYEANEHVAQETRLFDPSTGTTKSMRSKELVSDYRYFPDPDLPPLLLSDEFIAKIKLRLPEMPDEKKERFISQYGLNNYDASVLVADQDKAKFFESVADKTDPKMASAWVINNLFGYMNKNNIIHIDDINISGDQLAQLINLIINGTVSSNLAKIAFEKLITTNDNLKDIIEKNDLKQINDDGIISDLCNSLANDNMDKIQKAKTNPKMKAWFVGQIMQKTKGKINPVKLNKVIDSIIANN